MSKIWKVGAASSFFKHYEEVVGRGKYYTWIDNINDLHERLQAFRGDACQLFDGADIAVSADDLQAMASIKPKMSLHLDGFAPDFIHEFGLMIFSRQLREALDIGSDQIVFIPINASGSDQFIQQKEYEVGLVLPRRDAIDLEQSDLEFSFPRREAIAQLGEEFSAKISKIPGLGVENFPEKSISAVRLVVPIQDCDIDVDVFAERTLGQVCVSEAAARRVVDAGINDVQFTELAFKLGELPRVRGQDGRLEKWSS